MKKAVVSDQKKKIVKDFVDLIKKYPVVGIVNMENLPAPQLQKMRGSLRGKAVILMTKHRLIKHALDKAKESKKGIEELYNRITGMPAMIFTEDNPFRLCSILRKNKSKAPAKVGQKAPYDVIVPAGPTQFSPGPVISEFNQAGLKTGIENGKIVIKDDKVIIEEDQVFTQKIAGVLTKLGIQPMEIGLDLVAVYENGLIFGKNVLAIDEKEFMQKLRNAACWAFNLAVEAGVMTKDTTEFMIIKAFNEAKAVAVAQNILCDATVGNVLSKAEAQANAIKSKTNI